MNRSLEGDVAEMGSGRNAAPAPHENQDLCSLWSVMTNGLVEIIPGLVQRVAHQIRPNRHESPVSLRGSGYSRTDINCVRVRGMPLPA